MEKKKQDTKNKRKKRSIRTEFIEMTMIPALIIGIVLTSISINTLIRNMTNEIQNSLSIAAHSVYNTYSLLIQGDYAVVDGKLKKGNVILSNDYSILDELKASYQMEITLFYGQERMLSTIRDEDGNCLEGTLADPKVSKWVLEKGKEYFSKDLKIGGVSYYGYYIPIKNRDQSIVGMAFAGKPASEVSDMVTDVVIKSVAVAFIVILVTVLLSIVASQKLLESVYAVMEYLGHVSRSDFSRKMPERAMQRKDEIGDMAQYAADVGKTLLALITTDPLTKLYNRRACTQYLQQRIEKCEKYKSNLLTVAIGDIDYFKKVNDTYGHDGGDLVLTSLAQLFGREIEEKDIGIVARWGGEEFLFVINRPLDEAKEIMTRLLLEVRKQTFDFEGQSFHVTMSLGMNASIVGEDFDSIIRKADHALYASKENGRDQISTTDGTVIRLCELE